MQYSWGGCSTAPAGQICSAGVWLWDEALTTGVAGVPLSLLFVLNAHTPGGIDIRILLPISGILCKLFSFSSLSLHKLEKEDALSSACIEFVCCVVQKANYFSPPKCQSFYAKKIALREKDGPNAKLFALKKIHRRPQKAMKIAKVDPFFCQN